jgi:benzylsuccinate CoA-transferase BbsF subunit
MAQLPLQGLRVTDFCWVGAGSYTTKLLADMGAEVLKIESSTRLDALRLSGPFKDKIPGPNRSGYFADRNTSKFSITINLKTAKGIELVRRLIDGSDIVANNFTPGTMDELGLGYDELTRTNRSLIYISMSFQGADGPDRDTLGFGLTMSALVGLMHLSGLPGRPPAGTGTNYPDHIPNPCHAAFAVIAALRHRRRTGQGQKIDIAQIEPPLALLAPAVMDYAVNGRNTQPIGNESPSAAPRGVYPCLGDDRWIAISVQDDGQYRALVDCLQSPELSATPRWRSLQARQHEKAALDAAIGAATAKWNAEELMWALQGKDVPAGVASTAADVVANDPQLQHRQHWRRIPHAETGSMLYNAQPFRFGKTEVGPIFGAPLLGEHTADVCSRLLGLDAAAIKQLRAEKVLI